jgi:methionyl-tRNA formyltransferase
MKICIAGKNRVAVDGLRFVQAKYPTTKIYVIPVKNDTGKSEWQPSLRKYAFQNDIEIIDLHEISSNRIDLFLSLEFDSILKPKELNCLRVFNIHFSLLPKYRGVYTSAWPILNGESKSGVTLHRIDEGIDTGPIVDQIDFDLDDDENAYTLYEKYQTFGLAILKRNLNLLLNDKISAIPQIDKGTYYPKSSINYSSLEIDTNVSAEILSRQIRAYYFPAFQFPKLAGKTIRNPRISSLKSKYPPGRVVSINNKEIVFSTRTFDVICDLIF